VGLGPPSKPSGRRPTLQNCVNWLKWLGVRKRNRRPTLRELGAYRLCVFWYPTLLWGYPLAVCLTGHSQREGWNFLITHWGVIAYLLLSPIALITAGVFLQYLTWLIGMDG
jgi:hypothetical protein